MSVIAMIDGAEEDCGGLNLDLDQKPFMPSNTLVMMTPSEILCRKL